MSERDADFDTSRSTAEFRAFAERSATEAEQPWSMRVPGRKVAILAGIVVGAAIVLAIIAIVVLNV